MGISINEGQICRGRGRPPLRSDEETLRLIIDAAGQEFRGRGYAGAAMSAIAARAGMSTKTLYRLVPTKAELFRLVIRGRAGQFILAAHELDHAAEDLAAGLERLLIAYGNLAFDPEVITVYRLVIGECGRFPELGQTFFEAAIRPTSRAIADWLAGQRRRGSIMLDDPEQAADMLRGMMVMEPQRAALLAQAPPPDAAAIAARAKACAKVFLEGCRTARQDSPPRAAPTTVRDRFVDPPT
jgi:AcrR family transcriptional regulator